VSTFFTGAAFGFFRPSAFGRSSLYDRTPATLHDALVWKISGNYAIGWPLVAACLFIAAAWLQRQFSGRRGQSRHLFAKALKRRARLDFVKEAALSGLMP